jgi:hypothetical protein
MVNWLNIISTIIGSGLTIAVFNLVLNNFLLIPNVNIMEDVSDNGINTDETVMKITNNGPQAATHVVLTRITTVDTARRRHL